MPKRVHKKKTHRRRNRKGGDILADAQQGVYNVGSAISQGATNVGNYAKQGVVAADQTIGTFVVNPVKNVAGTAANEGSSWWNNWFGSSPAPAQVQAPQQMAQVQAPQQGQATAAAPAYGGSRSRRRRGHKRSPKGLFSGVMNMMGIKTKKRGHRGGIGGPYNGYSSTPSYFPPEFASFPSATGPSGANIYDKGGEFDPSKPISGGSMQMPLNPANFDANGNSYMFGGVSKGARKRKSRRCGGSKKKHGW